ncbi:MAG: zf-HC2 domain-containing protein [Gemmatimonadetes bacterium]|nr:zf-HC2 domain-containing protein [Gemmatimonadota bacterium]
MNDNGQQLSDPMVFTETGHLTPEMIAAYLGQEVSGEERQAVQQHLLTCKECRVDLAEASELGAVGRRVRWLAVGLPAAAAAVLAVVLLGPATRDATDDTPVLRGEQAEGTARFKAVSPVDGAEVSLDSLVFRWRSEGTGVHYLLTLTDENGDVFWTAGTSDTSLALPLEVGLATGQRYFWYVDALLEGARSSTTGVREILIQP